MQAGSVADAALPALRQELAIYSGPPASDGSPTWTLHDPVGNRFFLIAWPAFEILSRWHLGRAKILLDAVARETTLALSGQDVDAVLDFLHRHHLFVARSVNDSARLARVATSQRMSTPMWLLKHYLFFRIPLVRPMPFLRAVLPRIAWVFDPRFGWLMLAVALLGLALVSLQWDTFLHTFAAYSGWQGLLGIGAALAASKVVHELGHAFTAYRHGCRVPAMGVAFLVLMPVLYTDTNEVWKLSSRRARLQIAAAGMAAELALAAAATLLWSFLPDGPFRAGVFLLATSIWVVALLINLSPFMRFDGYFLLSDWLGVPNLHERAFALGRWHLRETLFGWKDPPPEVLTAYRLRFLTGFAYLTWLYRFALFVGIALLVYHLFFKALGILLLAVELGWFVAWPIQREMRFWWQNRQRLRANRTTLRTVGFLVLLGCAVFLPWPRGVEAPAVLGAARAQWIYASTAAQVASVAVQPGQTVAAGQELLVLRAPELGYQIKAAQAREQRLSWQVQQQALDERLQEHGATLRQRWEGAREELAGLQALGAQLSPQAPFAGQVVSLNPALHAGAWIARGERLLQIASPQGVKVEAYVSEAALQEISIDASARFVADEPGLPRVDCQVHSIDRIALATLETPALASPFGGPLPASLDARNRLQPHDTLFRVRLDRCEGLRSTERERTGVVIIGYARRSYAADWTSAFLAMLHREAGW